MKVAEHANSRNVDNEVAFNWWVPHVLKEREVITSQMTSRIRRTIHKYGIEVPTSLKYAADIDSKNKNTYWRDEIAKEISSTGVSFDTLETGKIAPV